MFSFLFLMTRARTLSRFQETMSSLGVSKLPAMLLVFPPPEGVSAPDNGKPSAEGQQVNVLGNPLVTPPSECTPAPPSAYGTFLQPRAYLFPNIAP